MVFSFFSLFYTFYLDILPTANLKQSILDAINDMIEELSLLYKNIADQAIEHVHAKFALLL